MDVDVEVDVDLDRYFGSLKGASKSGYLGCFMIGM